MQAEKLLGKEGWEREVARGLELGLEGASSIEDRTIPTFSRGELPHFAGINTFMVRRPLGPLPAPPLRPLLTRLARTRRKRRTWRTRGRSGTTMRRC